MIINWYDKFYNLAQISPKNSDIKPTDFICIVGSMSHTSVFRGSLTTRTGLSIQQTCIVKNQRELDIMSVKLLSHKVL